MTTPLSAHARARRRSSDSRAPLIRCLCLALAIMLPGLAAPAGAASWLDRLLGRGDTEVAVPEGTDAGPATTLDVEGGLREALITGSERVVDRLGVTDGFNADPAIRISLPPQLAVARTWLERVNLEGQMDEVEIRLNRAAEAAVPEARTLFVEAIREITIADAQAILGGGETAATDYLRGQMGDALLLQMRPVIEDSLAEVGALRVLDAALEQYRRVPFAPALDTDVAGYVGAATVDGIFDYLAREERAIREDPARRTTELLRQVFERSASR